MPFASLCCAVLLVSVLLDSVSLNGSVLDGPRLLTAGVGLFAAYLGWTASERVHGVVSLRIMMAVTAIMLLGLLLQLCPLPISSSVWQSASIALPKPLFAHISLDLGQTFYALICLIFLATVVALTGLVTIDRSRAEFIFGLLVTVSALTTLAETLDLGPNDLHDQAAGAVLAIVLAAAFGYLSIERYETRRDRQTYAGLRLGICLGGSLLVILVALIGMEGAFRYVWAAVCGLLVLILIVITRRFRGFHNVGLGLIILAPLAAGFSAFTYFGVELLPGSAGDTVPARMLEATPLTGNGAGTFGILSGVFRSLKDAPNNTLPGFGLITEIEYGLPVALSLCLLIVVAFISLVRGALSRGRDSVFVSAGAAVLASMAFLALTDVPFASSGLRLLLSAVLGLSLVQRQGRRS